VEPASVPLQDLLSRLASANQELLDLQLLLAAIPAPTGSESARAATVRDWFAAIDIPTETDDVDNVIARLGPASGPHLAVCAHMDTVFPSSLALDLRRDGARLHLPGISDNARGLAAMLVIGRELARSPELLGGPLELVATVGEEGQGDLRGAKHYFATRGAAATAAIALDGAGDSRIIHRALGSRRLRVEFDGPGGHSWTAYGTVNPISAVAACVAALARVSIPSSPRSSLTVARVGGGLSINSIPENAWFEVDIRSVGPEPIAELGTCLGELAAAAMAEENCRRTANTRELAVSITTIGDRPCGEIPAEHPLVEVAVEATWSIGREPDLDLSSTDANVPLSLGIPAISIGAGGAAGGMHTAGEWYDDSDGRLGVARAARVIVAASGLTAEMR
jgi:tripeptide aminopeptidase